MTTLRNIKSATVEELFKQYKNAASMHGEGRKQGDLKVTNRAADTVASVYRELRRRGGDVRQAILPLLLSDHPSIRGWAAAHALEFAPEQGQPILESLAKENGLIGLSALMTLKVWREGNLRFP